MDCVITAGGRPQEGDPLYRYTGGRPKALLDIAGRTMLERVIDALQQSAVVDEIVVVGLGDDAGQQFRRPVHHLPEQGSLVGNALAGVAWARRRQPEAEAILVSSADIPLITPAIINDFVERCQPFHKAIYYNLVWQEDLEARFPGSKRSFVSLREGAVAGGDMVLIRPEIVEGHRELWEALANGRKEAWRLARLIGPLTILKLLLKRLSLAEIQRAAERLLGEPVEIILNPHPEIAMDGDKPHQIEMLRSVMEKDQL